LLGGSAHDSPLRWVRVHYDGASEKPMYDLWLTTKPIPKSSFERMIVVSPSKLNRVETETKRFGCADEHRVTGDDRENRSELIVHATIYVEAGSDTESRLLCTMDPSATCQYLHRLEPLLAKDFDNRRTDRHDDDLRWTLACTGATSRSE
jgi:hypothetical protein